MSAPEISPPAPAGGGTPIGGSGAAGYLAKWTAATTLGGSTTTGATASPYVDSIGNVGIGTASPSSLAANYTTLDIRGSSGGGLKFGNATQHAYMYSDASGFALSTQTNLPLNFYTNNAQLRASVGSTSLDISSTSNYGLKLPATNGTTYNTDPNTLDCYAEKDLTATMTPGTSGTITLSSSTLKFTRIGRVVIIVGRLVIGSVSSPVGRLTINTGVGANEYPGTYAAAAVFPNSWQAGFTGAPSAVAIPASATVYLDRFTTGGVAIDVASYAQAGAEVSISLTYTL